MGRHHAHDVEETTMVLAPVRTRVVLNHPAYDRTTMLIPVVEDSPAVPSAWSFAALIGWLRS